MTFVRYSHCQKVGKCLETSEPKNRESLVRYSHCQKVGKCLETSEPKNRESRLRLWGSYTVALIIIALFRNSNFQIEIYCISNKPCQWRSTVL
jgi:hypothetical protein